MQLDNEALRLAGRALFGRRWVEGVTALLAVKQTTVIKWKQGHSRITPYIWPKIVQALRDRGSEEAAALADQIAKAFSSLPPLPPQQPRRTETDGA